MMHKIHCFTAALLMALLLSGCSTSEKNTDIPASVSSASATSSSSSGIGLEDGVYTVDFNTDSRMFQANEALDRKGTLTVQDGQAILHISLGSKNILHLYPGMAADAINDEANWLQPTLDSVTYGDGTSEEVHGFDVPVPVVGDEFDLALIGKKGVWYDHKVSVQNPAARELPAEAPADGEYLCQATLSGGSGRATIQSPALLKVKGGSITAVITWSSPYYEYMLVDGIRYDPVQAQGNSTFEIPVALDLDLSVSACTVAMSEPHLIDYTLRFDRTTLCAAQT